MARKITDIKKEITTALLMNSNWVGIYNLDTSKTWDEQYSKVSMENLMVYAVATAIWTLEKLMDIFTAEVDNELKKRQPHTLYWYVQKAKDFMYGYALPNFEEDYDTSSLTEEQITDAKMVTQAACVKTTNTNGRPYLRIKLAKGTYPDLAPLDATELNAFTDYMNQIQDAGVQIECTSHVADKIVMDWSVEYNPQLIDATGNPLSSEGVSVREAIIQFLMELPFNGLYQYTTHIDYVQKECPGVRAVRINNVAVTYRGDVGNAVPEQKFDGLIPDAGWMRFYDDNDLTINFIEIE